ncbi:phosphate ABC transporter permease subunit PstC [Helicobacter winghamensis]|uniref:Phosphate transport system permease protein n=1 Tax=Helicobacter winghamensis TaxID=157268 RepID=A0A2N3PJV5_9HELI|nr:phosphate ABC transporter permease subunit PstC [Helicobacter winghamensis]EEO26331.1 phosphate ABC transporter, permease protein PstC [Helicobacter winghamensis ATCC BAA-430]PKT77316.1 phosphate ABC transporter permease subunit PstC [Helicobacter winghamensis]PKT77517.1 phosphate ABC transporter permease subunit PstC [Helicobacter winghamensis]PKT77751.1 phosphate ABC transporter permease subunit PstC [Helicobacter winghamensis]PKT81482.1 phosphate ABC transporter permease subunit PstC [He
MQEKIFKGIFALSALLSIFAVLMICFFLFANAIPTISQIGLFDFLFGMDWYPIEEIFGIFPMIVGSIYVTALAIFIGVPLGVLSAIYLSRFASKREQKYILPAIELLGAIPSVVYGFFGLVVIVPLLATTFNGIPGKSVLAASLILSIMILPTIILVSKASIDALPDSYYEGALALGASKERSVFFALIPAAKSGILASIILGIGRAIGEAMAVIMVAGNQALIPTSVLEGVRTLTTNIVLEMGYAQDLHREVLIANAVVLFVFILLINTCFNALKKEAK